MRLGESDGRARGDSWVGWGISISGAGGAEGFFIDLGGIEEELFEADGACFVAAEEAAHGEGEADLLFIGEGLPAVVIHDGGDGDLALSEGMESEVGAFAQEVCFFVDGVGGLSFLFVFEEEDVAGMAADCGFAALDHGDAFFTVAQFKIMAGGFFFAHLDHGSREAEDCAILFDPAAIWVGGEREGLCTKDLIDALEGGFEEVEVEFALLFADPRDDGKRAFAVSGLDAL